MNHRSYSLSRSVLLTENTHQALIYLEIQGTPAPEVDRPPLAAHRGQAAAPAGAAELAQHQAGSQHREAQGLCLLSTPITDHRAEQQLKDTRNGHKIATPAEFLAGR